jgi:glutamate N-acetyltransferase/amino-acid N-acetyltransferase
MFDIFPLKGSIDRVDGFFCDGVNAGIKNDILDLGFIYSETPCRVHSLFTTNRFQAAPIAHYKKYESGFETNFLLTNSKNANALTVKAGVDDIDEILASVQERFSSVVNPIMSSTGVIGVRLPKEKIISALEKLDLNSKNSDSFAKSIMTTDSFQKEIALEVVLEDGSKFRIGAVAKGAGMINPAMATMLCFIATDASVPKDDMVELLEEINEITFNAISVDGDTSTNDTVTLMANANSGVYDKSAFREALKVVMQKLAFDILKDGEGANKFVAFEVKNAKSLEEAKRASKALSNSSLVKTALFGEDPNWGRIASTIGASSVECSEEKLKIYFEDILVYDCTEINFSKEIEEKCFEVMQKSEFRVVCDLGVGEANFTSYGCDLSYEYVKINADYRT